MTLIVCAKAQDGMVFASDSRGTFGDPQTLTAQNDTMKKVFKLSEYAVLLMSGASEIGENIIQEIIKDVKEKSILGVKDIVNHARNRFKERYDEWFSKYPPIPHPQNPAFVRPQLGIIIGGYNIAEKKEISEARIYSMLSVYDFAPMLHNYGFALQGVPQYALYLMNRLYAPSMKTEHLKQLLAYVITETATQDGKVGGPVQIALITNAQCKELNIDEALKVLRKNESNSARLKELFFEEEQDGKK